jgi:fusion and transport protein UGO1
MESRSHPLRPYYTKHDEPTFVVPAPTISAAPRSSTEGHSLALPPHGQTNRYISPDGDAALALASERTTPSMVLRALLISGALQYTSTCLAMPFEVGKLLLQVQWIPRDEVWTDLNDADNAAKPEKEEADEGASAYFEDAAAPRRADSAGYVVGNSVGDADARPEYVVPVVVKGGVWEMMKAVGRGKEGWLGLWKGTLMTFCLDVSTQVVQPVLTSFFSLFAPRALYPVPIAYSPQPLKTLSLLLVSHSITGVLVSPLDLVRTRLIAQSTLPVHRKYTGPIDALRKILAEEGGWRTTYLHPLLLVPTLLDCVLRPLLSLSAPLVIENLLRVDPSTGPITYALAELVLSTLALCITLPIETVRRRLQLQYHAPLRKRALAAIKPAPTVATAGLRTCVETRPVPYAGVAEALYRIVTEETSAVPAQTKTGPVYYSSLIGGFKNLYRGFGMSFSANVLVFILTLVTGERDPTPGWTEI